MRRTLVLALMATLAQAAQGQDGLPLVELDPYLVESGGLPWSPGRAELAESGRLLLGTDTTRSGSWLSLEDLQRSGAASVGDLFWQMAGAGSPARFGVVSVPNVRGDAADTLLNGQRRGDNLFGLAPSLTLVESVELLNGPPLVRSGPGKRTGGSFNLTSKRPVPGLSFGQVDLRLGTWVPGSGSYGTLEAGADVNVPLPEGQALRLAAGVRADRTYYKDSGGRDDYRDLYAAWRRNAAGGGSLDWLVYFLDGDRPQTLGVNRPWQGLIDHGQYISGVADAQAGQGVPPGFLDPGIADPGLLTAGPESLVVLDPRRVLMSPGDSGKGQALLSQVLWLHPLGPDLQLEQAVLVERVRRDKTNAFFYAEAVRQWTFDSQTRIKGQALNPLGPLAWEGGLHLRLEDRDNRTNYWNEFAYAFDLSTGGPYAAYAAFPQNIAPGAAVDAAGRPWYVPSSLYGTPETTNSRLRQAGLYSQAEQQFASGWAVRAGLRADAFFIEAAEPADLVPVGRWHDRADETLFSATVSVHRTLGRSSHYFTAGWFGGVAGNTVGDGINLYPPGELHREDFTNRSQLIEWGGQWQATGALTVRWAAFDQRRQRQEFFGANDVRVRGAEVAAEWTLSAKTRLTLAAHALDARYDQAAPAEFGGGSIWNVYAAGAGPDGQGNGLGYIRGFFANSLAPGDHRLPGLSKWVGNIGLRQELAERLFLQLWGGWQSSQQGNLAGEYVIPAQMEWNAALLYTRPRWDLQVVVRNLFDAANWVHNGDTFFDQMLVSRALPLRLEGRFRLRF